MSKLIFHLLLWSSPKKRASNSLGFTLTELLVVVIIGSLIVSSLMTLVIQLVATEQRESAKTETQREMQLALDYITSDLRQAVYVYDGSEHPIARARVAGQPSYLPYLPAQLRDANNYRPVLAFWKPEPIDVSQIADGEPNFPVYNPGGNNPPAGNCNSVYTGTNANIAAECNNLWLQRRAYTFVAYFEAFNPDNDPRWKGESRIVRYELPKYQNLASRSVNTRFARNPLFVDPAELGPGGFQNWPWAGDAGSEVNCQLGAVIANDPCPTRPPQTAAGDSSQTATLVDFVDTSQNTDPGQANYRAGEPDQCPQDTFTDADGNVLNQYLMMPRSNAQNTPSFFSCIRNVQGNTGTAQDIRVYLRGNANGRGGGIGNSFLPTLESRITMRGVIDRSIN